MKRELLCALALACGSPAPQQTTVALPLASSKPAAPVKRHASAAVANAFTLSAPKITAYADFEGLARTKLVSALLPQLMSMMRSKIAGDATTAGCFDAFPSAVKELLAGSNDAGFLWVVRYDPSRLAAPGDCFTRFTSKDESSATAPGGIFLYGTRSIVEQAASGGGIAPPGLELDAGEYVRLAYDDKPIKVDATIALSDARFALRADAGVSEQLARIFASNFDQATRTPPSGLTEEEGKLFDHVVHASKLVRTGNRLAYTFILDEGVTDQARDLGMVAALAISGMQKYLVASKQAEAKNSVSFISRAVVESWEREELPPVPRSKKRLRSFPPVPKSVPRGVAYQTTPADWAPWSPLKFEMDEPQRYQYEVKAAADGMSADVIARGDLNGDGKTSQFVVHVTVLKDRSLKLSLVEETDADE